MSSPAPGAQPGPDGLLRCPWSLSAPEYLDYHDQEWGRPVHDDTGIFERLCLEAFQSGLSWLTILRKREGFRAAFSGFSIEAVARTARMTSPGCWQIPASSGTGPRSRRPSATPAPRSAFLTAWPRWSGRMRAARTAPP